MKPLNRLVLVLVASLLPVLSIATEDSQAKQAEIEQFKQIGKETNYLVQTGSVIALDKLTKKQGFGPYAYMLLPKGKTIIVQPEGALKDLAIKDKIMFLRGQIRHSVEQGEEVIAAAIFTDSIGKNKSNGEDIRGITVEVEHIKGPSVIQFVPYEFEDGVAKARESTSKIKPRSFLFASNNNNN